MSKGLLSALLALASLAASARGVEISVEKANDLLAARVEDPWERRKEASAIAWNEMYVIDALLDLYDATGDAKYLDEFVRRADRVLSHRDDQRGFADATGVVHKRWSIATKYTVAEATLNDAAGHPVMRLRSTPAANNHMTKVTVEAGEGGTFTLRAVNSAWKRKERFERLSMDPASPRYFASVIDAPEPLPKPPPGEAEAHSLLLRADPVEKAHAATVSDPPAAQQVNLAPLWHAHVGYVGIIYHPLLKFALRVRQDAALKKYRDSADAYVRAAEASYAELRDYWRQGPGEGEGYYIGCQRGGAAPYDNVGQAFNYLAKQACAELAMFQLTGKVQYQDHAVRIARLFKHRLEYRPAGDLYIWKYWYEPMTIGWSRDADMSDHYPTMAPYTVAEDASHATLDVAMVLAMNEAKLVFDDQDVARFANTFTRNVVKSDGGGFNAHVDATPGSAQFEQAAVFGWLDLAKVDPTVYKLCRQVYEKRGKDDFKSLARLLKWQRLLDAAATKER